MPKLTLLDNNNFSFPCPSIALTEPNGLLAVGGDLSATRLYSAYQHGVFPWYNDDEPILWWSPDPRCIIFTHKFHVSKSFQRFLKKNHYKITINNCFSDVITGCREPRSYQKETWINDQIAQGYLALHQQGHAHSIEVWEQDSLIGGIYGVMTNNVFCGESMFSRRTNASKVALYTLSIFLAEHGIKIIDCQIPNDHLLSLGATTLARTDFLRLLKHPLKSKLDPIDWQPRQLYY